MEYYKKGETPNFKGETLKEQDERYVYTFKGWDKEISEATEDVTYTAQYETKTLDTPFYGVYCGQSALPLAPDTLCYLENDILRGCTVYDYETDTEIPVYDLAAAEGNDAYALFLSGSKSLLTITNPQAKTGRELIVFRDSFASSLAPLLAEGYAKITLVDIRYVAPERQQQ